MFGAIAKTWYAEKNNIDPKDLFVVSVMPCTAKKFEAERVDHSAVKGLADIDASITVRELARMIRKAGINFKAIPDAEFDSPFGLASGAGTIFGATGGVMEAALRTAVETLTGEELANLDFVDVRGTEGIKEAEVEVAKLEKEAELEKQKSFTEQYFKDKTLDVQLKAVEAINSSVKTIITDGDGNGYAGLIGIKEILDSIEQSKE